MIRGNGLFPFGVRKAVSLLKGDLAIPSIRDGHALDAKLFKKGQSLRANGLLLCFGRR